MDAYQIQTIISFLGIMALGILTVIKEPGNRLNISVAFFYIAVALWQLDLFFIKGAFSAEQANSVSRILRPAMLLMPVAFLRFSILLTKTGGRALLLERVMAIYAGILVVLNSLGFGVKGFVFKEGMGYVASPDLIYRLYMLLVAVNMLTGFYLMLKKYYSKDCLAAEKTQIQYMVLGIGIGFTGALTNILNIFGFNFIYPVAGFCVLVFFCLTTYAILSNDMLNVRELLQKAIAYAFTAAIAAVIYGIYFYMLYAGITPGVFRVTSFFIITLMIILAIDPTFKMLDRMTRKAFFISNYDFQVLLQNVLIEIGLIKEYGPLFERTITNAVKVLKLKSSVMFFYDNEKKCFVLYSPRRNENVCIAEKHPIFEYVGARKDAVAYKKIVDDVTYYYRPKKEYININIDEVLSLLREYGAEICIPLMMGGEIKGLWIIGAKANNSVFQREEVSWLKNIAVQLSVIAENIMLYDKLINSERLAMLGKMSAAVAHEIRNPLTGLDGFVQMVRADRGNKAAMDRFLDIAPEEFRRLEKLTDNLLALSHTSALKIEELDLVKLLDNVNDLMEHTFRTKNIKVIKNYSGALPVKADVKQIRQVVLNIIMNSIQAMEKGGTLGISCAVKEVYGKNYSTLYFWDSGPGFDEKTLGKIFEPFFTTKADGTGLGLAISKNIMEAHGGFIRAGNSGSGAVVEMFFPEHIF
jgi:signal transduction histidine kinase